MVTAPRRTLRKQEITTFSLLKNRRIDHDFLSELFQYSTLRRDVPPAPLSLAIAR